MTAAGVRVESAPRGSPGRRWRFWSPRTRTRAVSRFELQPRWPQCVWSQLAWCGRPRRPIHDQQRSWEIRWPPRICSKIGRHLRRVRPHPITMMINCPGPTRAPTPLQRPPIRALNR